jgi:membrane protease YdiL (CAAX protease family)
MPAPNSSTAEASASAAGERSHDVFLFFVLACAITWATNLPWMLACVRHVQPAPYAMPLMGLGAWGPTLAAVFVAARRGVMRDVFGRWKTRPGWVFLALCVSPIALHLPATLIEVALGGRPAQWFYPPVEPERIAGLVMFSLGEEFGWRGYAYPRVVRMSGPVLGNLLLGRSGGSGTSG